MVLFLRLTLTPTVLFFLHLVLALFFFPVILLVILSVHACFSFAFLTT